MLEAISKCKTGETTAIGKFHGFELLVEKNFLGINSVSYTHLDVYKRQAYSRKWTWNSLYMQVSCML